MPKFTFMQPRETDVPPKVQSTQRSHGGGGRVLIRCLPKSVHLVAELDPAADPNCARTRPRR